MTETDATKRPLTMPEKFIPYLEKYRIYKVFKVGEYILYYHMQAPMSIISFLTNLDGAT